MSHTWQVCLAPWLVCDSHPWRPIARARGATATRSCQAAEERERVAKESAIESEQAARDARLMFDTVTAELDAARKRTAEAQRARVEASSSRDGATAELRAALVKKQALEAEVSNLETRVQTLRQEESHVAASATDAVRMSNQAREQQHVLAQTKQEVRGKCVAHRLACRPRCAAAATPHCSGRKKGGGGIAGVDHCSGNSRHARTADHLLQRHYHRRRSKWIA